MISCTIFYFFRTALNLKNTENDSIPINVPFLNGFHRDGVICRKNSENDIEKQTRPAWHNEEKNSDKQRSRSRSAHSPFPPPNSKSLTCWKSDVHIFFIFLWLQTPRGTCEQIIGAALGSGWTGGAGGCADRLPGWIFFSFFAHLLIKVVWLYAQHRTKTGGPRIWAAEGTSKKKRNSDWATHTVSSSSSCHWDIMREPTSHCGQS